MQRRGRRGRRGRTASVRSSWRCSFDPDWTYEQPDAHDTRSRSQKNVEHARPEQGTCVHLGECDIGCPVKARNTLDFNYLAVAGRTARASCRCIWSAASQPTAGGYRVDPTRSAAALVPGSVTSRVGHRRSRLAGIHRAAPAIARERRTLPDAQRATRRGVEQQRRLPDAGDPPVPRRNPSRGPTITCAIDLLDGECDGQDDLHRGRRPAGSGAGRAAARRRRSRRPTCFSAATREPAPLLSRIDLLRTTSCRGSRKRATRPTADSPLKNGRLFLDWDIAASEETIDAVASVHRKLAMLTGGMALTPLTWTIGRDLITPHPLGGCNMAASAADGVVDSQGRGLRPPRTCSWPTAPSCRRRSA